MQKNDLVEQIVPDVLAWQRHIHANPELGFKEHATSDFVARKLREFGLEVHRDISATAVVGVLKVGSGSRKIMFRAELDALPVKEDTGLPHSSKVDGVMHACGHDAHSAILLGAAKLLSQTRDFDGTIYFVFQPAEEVLGGGKRLIEDGLLNRFPAESVFSQHSWPGIAEGSVVATQGPLMAAVDDFTLTFSGIGAHAAMPELGDDPVLAAGDFIGAVQRVVSRSINPLAALVVSVTQVHGGSINNIVPSKVEIQGTARFFDPKLSDHVEAQIGKIAGGIAQSHGISFALDYRKGYPAVINTERGAAAVRQAVTTFMPKDKVIANQQPTLGCEDFAYILNAVGEGAHIWLGAGVVGPRAGLHGDQFVFNDKLLPLGLRVWAGLAGTLLPRGQ